MKALMRLLRHVSTSMETTTRRRSRLNACLATALMISVAAVVNAGGDSTNVTANLVLGQPNFSVSGYAATIANTGLALPYGVAVDSSVSPNRLYVADTANNRVLGWNSIAALTTGAPADLVIGQVDFSSSIDGRDSVTAAGLSMPWSVAVDSRGNLYVADNGDNRVLEYDTPFNAFGHLCNSATPCQGGLSASMVIGQGKLGTEYGTRDGCVGNADTACFDEPSGLWIDDDDNLYVADTLNNRVVIFLNPLGSPAGCAGAGSTSGCAGDVVADYSLGECTGNKGFLDAKGDCTRPRVTMLGPNAVGVDSKGNVYAADTQDNRVLEFDKAIESANLVADRVYGRDSSGSNFIPGPCADGQGADPSPSASAMCTPSGVAFDSQDNLYVSDYGNSRVLVFEKPLGNFDADLVLGQGSTGTDFDAGACYGGQPPNTNPSASDTGMCNPAGIVFDSKSDLFAADTGNSRVLEFVNPLGVPTPTATATATSTSTATPTARATPTATPTPTVTATPTPTPTPVDEKLTVSPRTLNFGKVLVSTTSGEKTVTIKNAGKRKTGHPVILSMESSSNDAFAVVQECPETLAPGAVCKVKVTFSPGAITTKQTAVLRIDSNVVGGGPTVTLVGSGKAPKK